MPTSGRRAVRVGRARSRSGASASAGSSRPRCSRCRPRASDGFPWSTWAGSLNLFVWLVVGGVPDLGLPSALPAARARRCCLRGRALVLARAGGGTGRRSRAATRTSSSSCTSASSWRRSRASRSPPALSALYLWQERRLKRREARSCAFARPRWLGSTSRRRRTIAVALPALTLGVAVGIVPPADRGGGFDALMA